MELQLIQFKPALHQHLMSKIALTAMIQILPISNCEFTHKLLASDGASGDAFGSKVEISGNRVIIAASTFFKITCLRFMNMILLQKFGERLF